jgi:hypothetical protein
MIPEVVHITYPKLVWCEEHSFPYKFPGPCALCFLRALDFIRFVTEWAGCTYSEWDGWKRATGFHA